MNQAVIEQDGMSRNTPANPTPDSLTGLLLPLSDRTLLLPNVAVAELIAYRNPQVAAGLPQWYLGQVAWRDLRLPLLSFEAASSGEQQPVLGSSARVVVINALGGRPHVNSSPCWCRAFRARCGWTPISRAPPRRWRRWNWRRWTSAAKPHGFRTWPGSKRSSPTPA